MQDLWARILAGEANSPDRFSKRTINLLATLAKAEAEQFTALCSFCWSFGRPDEDLTPLVFDTKAAVYNAHGIGYDSILQLDSIGLVRFQSLGVVHLDVVREIVLSYFGREVKLTLPEPKGNKFKVGKVLLTRIGLELAPISGAAPLDHFFDYTIEKWLHDGFAPSILSNVT